MWAEMPMFRTLDRSVSIKARDCYLVTAPMQAKPAVRPVSITAMHFKRLATFATLIDGGLPRRQRSQRVRLGQPGSVRDPPCREPSGVLSRLPRARGGARRRRSRQQRGDPAARKDRDSQVAKRPVLSVGDRVGRYLVLSSLGAGGMGVVFAAYDPQLDRKVALKLLRANLAGATAKEARTRLKREAQAMAQLNHPNVVGVYDVGTTDDGDVYIAMEFVEGDTLTRWLGSGRARGARSSRCSTRRRAAGRRPRGRPPPPRLQARQRARRRRRARARDGLRSRALACSSTTARAVRRRRAAQQARARQPAAGRSHRDRHRARHAALHAARAAARARPSTRAPISSAFASRSTRRCGARTRCRVRRACAMLEHGEKAHRAAGLEQGAGADRARRDARAREGAQKRYPTLSALVHELAPPPQRSPVQYIALAAVGALLVTVAIAAAMMMQDADVRRQRSTSRRSIY